jgi:polyisoprenoid-binding protein YceI
VSSLKGSGSTPADSRDRAKEIVMKLRHSFVPAVLLALLSSTALAADNYKIDSEHATVIFRVSHFNIGNAYGRFNDPTGTVTVDSADPSKTAFTFEVKTENVDTHNEKRDAHLKSPDFFNAKEFPVISFKSTAVKLGGDNKFEVTGDLTMHGVTKPITFNITKTGEADTGRMGYRTAWEADVNLKRSDWGMKGMIGPIGDDVHLNISFEAVKS